MSKIELAIKFGSNEIIVYRKGFGIIAKVPAYLAVMRDGKKVKIKATGKNAEKFLYSNPDNVEVLCPIHNSVIVDEKMATALLTEVFKTVIEDKFMVSGISALVAIPSTLNETQLIQIKRVLLSSGISKVEFVYNSVCAREELELDPHSHLMVVDIGKFLTDITVNNEFNFTFGRTYFIGGADMDKSVTTFVRDNHGLEISDRTSEQIKNEVATLYERDLNRTEYIGFDDNGKLVKRSISANEVRVAIQGEYAKIVELVHDCLKLLSKDVAKDLYSTGIMFVGGASSISGFYEYLKKQMDYPIIITEAPADSVIMGAGKLLGAQKEFMKIKV